MVFYNSEALANDFELVLKENFEYTQEESVARIVGLEINVSPDSIIIHQNGYIQNKGKEFNADLILNRYTIPMKTEVSEGEPSITNVPYRGIIGSIMWAQTGTRPDVAYAVSKISKFLENHSDSNWKGAQMVLRYLFDTSHYGIKYEHRPGPG